VETTNEDVEYSDDIRLEEYPVVCSALSVLVIIAVLICKVIASSTKFFPTSIAMISVL